MSKADETIPGGRYRVGGRLVDAWGNPVFDAEAAGGGAGTLVTPETAKEKAAREKAEKAEQAARAEAERQTGDSTQPQE